MYVFIEPKTYDTQIILEKQCQYCSSDVSKIEGYVCDEEIVKTLDNGTYKTYAIPQTYQDDIDSFITDYWDGEFTFECGHMKSYLEQLQK